MTHHSPYHPSKTQQLDTLRSDTDPEELNDLIDSGVEEEQELIFARALGYHPETV
jgi:hypothetical protein